MSEISEVEKELLEVSGFKGKHPDRQDYLAALTQAIEARVTDDEFDSLTDDAVEWYENAVNAINSNLEIPDFAGEGDEEETDTEEEGEENDEAGRGGTEGASEGADEASNSKGDGDDDGDAEPDRRSDNSHPRKAKAAKKSKGNKSKPAPKPRDYTALTGEKDRYGIIIGTKTHDAVKMYEKGCTTKEIKDELGGSHYNILRKLMKDGHHVEKEIGGIWKIIHKDDYGKKAKGR